MNLICTQNSTQYSERSYSKIQGGGQTQNIVYELRPDGKGSEEKEEGKRRREGRGMEGKRERRKRSQASSVVLR